MTDAPAPVSFTIPGRLQPEVKRQVRVGTWTRRVDKPEAQNWKQKAAVFAAAAMQGHALFDEPLHLTVRWYRLKPSGYKRAENWPWKRPDLANLLKILEDALTGIVWRDDSLICEEHLSKRFGDSERVEVTVEVLEPEWPYRKPPKLREAAERAERTERT